MTDWTHGIPADQYSAGRVDFHGGPLAGRQKWYTFKELRLILRIKVPVWNLEQEPFEPGLGSILTLAMPQTPQLGVFLYALSLERWPIPPEGPRWIAYPALA